MVGMVEKVGVSIPDKTTQEGQLQIIEIQRKAKGILEEKTGMSLEGKIVFTWQEDNSVLIEINEDMVCDVVEVYGEIYIGIIDIVKGIYKLFYDKIKDTIHKFNKKWM